MVHGTDDKSNPPRPLRHYPMTTVVTAFTTNLAWEMTQMRAYRELEGQPWWETVGTCAVAAGADVLLTLVPYGAGAVVTRNFRWT